MNSPSYNITFEDRAGYLFAHVEADEVSFEMVIEYTNEISQRLRKSKNNRLLLVVETPVLLSTDCYEIASYVLRNAVSGKIRIAVLDRDPGHAARQKQISTASRHAGLDIDSFGTIEAAEQWLLGK